MKTPKNVDPVEFRAAALFAAWNDCHDDDGLLDDPITSQCIAHMLGMRDVGRAARPVFELYQEMIS